MQKTANEELPTISPDAVHLKSKSCTKRCVAVTLGLCATAALTTMLAVHLLPTNQLSDIPLSRMEVSVGSWWLYSAEGDKWEGERLIRLVVAEVTDDNYIIGVTSEEEAVSHGILGHIPWLGRVARADASAYENGDRQEVSPLGLKTGTPLAFSLFSVNWRGNVSAVEDDSSASVVAVSEHDDQLKYTYSKVRGAGILPFELTYSAHGSHLGQGERLKLKLRLISQGSGYQGEAWFARARDLLAKRWQWTSDAVEVAHFQPGEHPQHGAWDMLGLWCRTQHGDSAVDFEVRAVDGGDVALKQVWGKGVRPRPAPHLLLPPFAANYSIKVEHSGSSGTAEVYAAGLLMKRWEVLPQ